MKSTKSWSSLSALDSHITERVLAQSWSSPARLKIAQSIACPVGIRQEESPQSGVRTAYCV